ncbi:MAG: hypothetical protein IPK53_04400 [bacterium]|nr:hypothetical protein [bacterium]
MKIRQTVSPSFRPILAPADVYLAVIHAVMPASKIPPSGRFETSCLLEGEAEDQARIVSVTASQSVVFGQFSNCVKSLEWTDIDPGAAEFKFYASGIGLIREHATTDESSGMELVAVRME